MQGALGQAARGLLIASALFFVASLAGGADAVTMAAKRAKLAQDKSLVSVTNGILTVQYNTTDGRFSITTGSSHPSPNQTVFYGVGTSYMTLRDSTSRQVFVNCESSGNTTNLNGYTLANMCATPPVVTPLGTGFRATYTLTNWIVQQDVEINGSTIADTNVRQKVTVTNTTHQPRDYGLRYLWDWEVAGNDSSYFRARNPDGSYLGPTQFTDFAHPTFQLFEEVNNPETPTFHVYGTVGGGSLIPTPTTPDQVRYASWGSAYSNPWEFPETSSDSATVHFWGYDRPITLHGNRSDTFVEYVTSQLSAVTPPSAQVSVSSNTMSFGDVPVGSSSAPRTVTITSTGEVPYQINNFGATASCQASTFCASGDFVCSTDCNTAPASYGMNASCHVNASFAPNATGPQSTVIYICDNATGSPRSITLTGNGIPRPALTITPSPNDFGNVLVGARSAPVTFTVTNPGANPVTLGMISTIGAFQLDLVPCGSSIAAGGSCAVRVVFAPTVGGRADGWLVVPDAATGLDSRAALFGTGIQEARLDAPVSLDLGAYTLGTPPISQVVQILNIGNAVVSFGRMSIDAPFTIESGCGLNLPPGQSCGVRIGFSASAIGDYHAVAAIESNAVGGTVQIAVTARAIPVPVPVVRLSPTAIGFGDRIIGSTSPAQRVTVANQGSAPAIFTGNAISIDFVIVGSTCAASLAPNATCTIDVAMRALSAGPVGGQLVVNSNATEGGHATVDLSGTGCRPFTAPGNRFGNRSACSP